MRRRRLHNYVCMIWLNCWTHARLAFDDNGSLHVISLWRKLNTNKLYSENLDKELCTHSQPTDILYFIYGIFHMHNLYIGLTPRKNSVLMKRAWSGLGVKLLCISTLGESDLTRPWMGQNHVAGPAQSWLVDENPRFRLWNRTNNLVQQRCCMLLELAKLFITCNN